MIYITMFTLLSILSVSYDFNSKRRFSNKWYNFVLLLFILVAGLRYKVGGDTLVYYHYYENLLSWSEIEFSDLFKGRYSFLWNVLATTSKSISDNFVVLQLIQAGFVNATIFWFIKKHTKYRFTSLLLYFLFAYLYFNMEIMRESIAISFFLISYQFFQKERWALYFMIAFVAFLFHFSAFIIFVFPLLKVFKFNLKNIFFVTLLTIIFLYVFINTPGLINILLYTEVVEMKYEIYSELSQNVNGKIVSIITYLIVPFYLLRIYIKTNHDGTKFKDLYLSFFMIVTIYLVYSGFGRFLNYMTPYMIIVYAELLNSIYNQKKYNEVKRLVVIGLIVFTLLPKVSYYSQDTSEYYPDTIKFNLWYPYSSIFTEEEYVFREYIRFRGE